jgi:hypothetical protein
MFTLDFIVTTSCCDAKGNLKLYSALQMMQDCSEMWIDTEPVVKEYFQQQNMTQLLASRQVEVVRVPQFKERRIKLPKDFGTIHDQGNEG